VSRRTRGGPDIAALRGEIDALDDCLMETLNKRAALARHIGELKAGAPVYRPEREAQVLRRVTAANKGPLGNERIATVFREVISSCRALEQALRVAYLGPAGTFSEMAALKQFGHAVQALPFATLDEVFRAAETGGADFAVVPVENSTEGAVGRSLDLLLQTPLRICAEIRLRVRQNLMRKAKGTQGVKRVYSHAQSLGQCQRWLAQHLPQAERVPVSSNAEAARLAAQRPAPSARRSPPNATASGCSPPGSRTSPTTSRASSRLAPSIPAPPVAMPPPS